MDIIRLLRSELNAFSKSVVVTSQTISVPSQAAGESYLGSVNITAKAGSGYYPIGIVGFTAGTTLRSIQAFRISGAANNAGTIAFRVKNHSTGTAAATTYTAYILWTKKPLVKITGGGGE